MLEIEAKKQDTFLERCKARFIGYSRVQKLGVVGALIVGVASGFAGGFESNDPWSASVLAIGLLLSLVIIPFTFILLPPTLGFLPWVFAVVKNEKANLYDKGFWWIGAFVLFQLIVWAAGVLLMLVTVATS
jgi:hypothetical protein